ncbi:MAG: hypothetical protein CMB97_16735 [Flavobacteriaceae bacterium]|jgi:hypothetical protein|nr:hypothetical protein [Flavobacteriaceae bacterium]|tara:strand:+ start:1066 stop:1248 length:183 start_codon:yes stop_codon:yes gene_type:complete
MNILVIGSYVVAYFLVSILIVAVRPGERRENYRLSFYGHQSTEKVLEKNPLIGCKNKVPK